MSLPLGRTTVVGSSPGFVADYNSITRDPGGQINWDLVPDSYRITAKTIISGADKAIGANSLTVAALPVALPIGAFLDFGHLVPVTVTVNDSSVSAGDVGITILALPGPIPSGARLNFSGGTNAQVVEVNGDHAAGATTLVVLPLDGTVANSATALFIGGDKQARVNAAAPVGAVTVSVDDLEFAIKNGDTATYGGTGDKVLPSGKIMARLGDNSTIPRDSVTDGSTSCGLLTGDARENARQDAFTGNGLIRGGLVYDALLPDHLNASFATWIGEINTLGPGLATTPFSDSRAS